MTMRASMNDVAIKAGVSIATVSHVLNGTRGTSPKVRQRVLRAVEKLAQNLDAMVLNTNYDSNRTLNAVRRLVGLQVSSVAILTSQIASSVIEMLAERKIATVY